MFAQQRKRGFTLIEVMIIIAIIGIFATIGVAVLGRNMGNQRAKAAVRSVADLMLLARTEAIRTGTNHIVYIQLDPAAGPLEDKSGTPVAALLIADADADGLVDAGEYKASVPFDPTNSLSWGSTFAAVSSTAAPNDNAAGTFPATDPDFSCCTFTDPGGNPSSWVVFLPDGMPRSFETGPFNLGNLGAGGGAVYVTSGRRDTPRCWPLGSVRARLERRRTHGRTDPAEERAPRRASSFTLIELLIALNILGSGMLAMLVLQTQALADGARGKHTSGAAMIARDQLERIQLMPYSDADLAPVAWATPPWLDNGGDPDLGPGDVAVRVTQPGGDVIEKIYTVWYRVVADPGGNADLRLIDVEVVWEEAKISNNRPTRTGQPTVALSTLIVNNDR
jgi:prepilin-type N-terminal cleavage/methylation domain-containing protein